MAFLNGIIVEPTFEKEAIEKENAKTFEFFLHNGVIEIDATITDIYTRDKNITYRNSSTKNFKRLKLKKILKQ